MAAIDDITDFGQDIYFSINGSENDDTDDDLEIFQNDTIRAFNLWRNEYETEAYWGLLREIDYELGTIGDTTTFSFTLPAEYRTPVINQDKFLKFVLPDGTVISKFKMVDPNQRVNDADDWSHPDRATFAGRKIVLSRKPKETELTAVMVLDVVKWHPRLTRDDADALTLIPSRQLAILGTAKNMSLANVTKVSLSPTFAQKYKDELNKWVYANNQSNEVYDSQRDDYGYINGLW